MTSTLLGYTNRANVENFLGRTFTEVTNAEFNNYIQSAEAYINNYTGYNAETTTSGMLSESIIREKCVGKISNNGDLVIDLAHPPVHFDANSNPIVTLVEYNYGGIRVSLQITDGSNNALNTLLEVSENRRKVVYPSLYFLPWLSTVTPTAKVNLYNLRDVKFWVDISYIGGFSPLPADVVMATNLLVGDMLTRRDNPNFVEAVRQGSYQVQYFSRSSVPGDPGNKAMDNAKKLLDPYVRYTW